MKPLIGIIGGKGRMGALFADFFRQNGLQVFVSDIGTKLTNKDLATDCDVVIVSVPIEKTVKIIGEILPLMKKSQAIMDLTSVKEIPVKAMLKGDCEVLGLHPMFGNSNPIPGQTVIVCETKKSGKLSKWILDFLASKNVQIKKLSPLKHDEVMNIAQGLIHFAEIVFADAIRRTGMPVKELLQYTGKASELKVQLAARILDQDPNLYGNIQIQNPQALKSLRELLKSTNELFKIVEKRDIKSFEKYFLKTRKYLGNYTKDAYVESSYLIDKLMELRRPTKPQTEAKPSLKNVAVLGPENTFSDLAATSYLDKNRLVLSKFFVREIDEAFNLVENRKVAFGIVPVENKLHGSVRETLDALFKSKVHISSEFSLPIHHSLIVLEGATLRDIKTVVSHPQALSQCSKYIQKYLKKAIKEQSPSTGAAVEKLLATKDKSIAVIAPAIAADKPHLKILANNIEDKGDNCTTFVVIKSGELNLKSKFDSTAAKKTSIAFHFSQDAPGSLFSVFKDFADAKLNLSKIESRPTRSAFGDYIFFLDFDGSLSDSKVRKTLQTIESKVAKLRILGSY